MRIHLISSPRNVSTALMYSFAQRADTRVMDEPFYAYYLLRTGVEHPGRAEVLNALPNTADGVFDLIDRSHTKPVLFLKGMAHHLDGIEPKRLAAMSSLFFIREPRQTIASFAQVIEQPTLRDIGSSMLCELFDALTALGAPVTVLDSGDLLRDPARALVATCEALGIDFDDRMLNWPAGPRPEDGVWAKHWYANVHNTTSFARQVTSARPLPAHLQPLYEEALPYYERLRQHAITC